MPCIIPLILLICLSAHPGIVQGADILSLRDCIDKALKNQPSIRAAQQTVSAAEGRETQAFSPYLPQVNASTGYSESHQLGIALGVPVAGAIGNVITKS